MTWPGWGLPESNYSEEIIYTYDQADKCYGLYIFSN